MPGAPQPESQEDILAAAEASLTAEDIPQDDDAWGWPDPDCGMPAELMALPDAELEDLLAAAPSWTPGTAWLETAQPGAAQLGAVQSETAQARTAQSGARQPGAAQSATVWHEGIVPPRGMATENDGGMGWPAGFGFRDEAGGGTGFAEGGPLDVLAPGVLLAGLADAAHERLSGLGDDELIGVIRAWRRQASWAQARELAAVAELARRRPAEGSSPDPVGPGGFPLSLSEFLTDEIAAALTLTLRAAEQERDLALDLAGWLAGTAAALAAGQIDLAKAKVIAAGTSGLAAGHAAAVEAAVLPRAPGLTTGQLRAAVARAVLAADPAAARQQREQALAQARVDCWSGPTGTAHLEGHDLPAASALAADRRLCHIAAAWKKLGAQGGMDLLRAHAYLALLLGQDITVPPARLLPPPGAPAPGDSAPGAPVPGGSASPAGMSAVGVPVPGSASGVPVPGVSAPSGSTPPAGMSTVGVPVPGGLAPGAFAAGVLTPGAPVSGAPVSGASVPGGSIPGGVIPDLPPPACTHGGQVPAGLRRPGSGEMWPGLGDGLPPLAGSVHLTVPLTTLMELSDAPGAAGGYGPVDPDAARALACAAAGHPATRWQLTVTGPDGQAVGHGTASRRSAGRIGGGWTVTIATEPVAVGDCDHGKQEPGYRPSPALQRLVRARSTACSYPGCRRPAITCDLDHTIPHDDGGITCECNLAPLCRRHHRLKQAEGWKLEQSSPGVMSWKTPAGRRHITSPTQHPPDS